MRESLCFYLHLSLLQTQRCSQKMPHLECGPQGFVCICRKSSESSRNLILMGFLRPAWSNEDAEWFVSSKGKGDWDLCTRRRSGPRRFATNNHFNPVFLVPGGKLGPNTRVIPGDPTVVASRPKGAGFTMSQFRDQPEAVNLNGASKRELLEGYCGWPICPGTTSRSTKAKQGPLAGFSFRPVATWGESCRCVSAPPCVSDWSRRTQQQNCCHSSSPSTGSLGTQSKCA